MRSVREGEGYGVDVCVIFYVRDAHIFSLFILSVGWVGCTAEYVTCVAFWNVFKFLTIQIVAKETVYYTE